MYTVIVARPARRDMQEQHDWWAENRSVEQAARWYAAFIRRLRTLSNNPQIHPHAEEDGLWPYHVRQLNFGVGRKPTHRALFVIRDSDVVVLRVRHLAQAPLTFDDL
jgi:plasmid stabilization system protein ParE